MKSLIMNIKRVLSVSWLRTLYMNFYYFSPLVAIKFPILVGHGCKIGSLGARYSITIPPYFGSFCFGLKRGPFALGSDKSFWSIGKNTKLIIKGTCRMAKGANLKLFDNAVLEIGNGFTSNANLIISCANSIRFGEDNLLGWNITIMDNDGGHRLLKGGEMNEPTSIIFGNHVWIGSESSVLKGSQVADGSVIGFKSNVCGLVSMTTDAIIVGNPAKIKNDSIRWEH